MYVKHPLEIFTPQCTCFSFFFSHRWQHGCQTDGDRPWVLHPTLEKNKQINKQTIHIEHKTSFRNIFNTMYMFFFLFLTQMTIWMPNWWWSTMSFASHPWNKQTNKHTYKLYIFRNLYNTMYMFFFLFLTQMTTWMPNWWWSTMSFAATTIVHLTLPITFKNGCMSTQIKATLTIPSLRINFQAKKPG